jgi:ubiquinone/menaquinone biosynthesis C-methylase UbiE
MAWYEQSFGEDYLIVYKHRDLQGAYEEVRRMMDWLQLEKGAEILDFCCGMGRHSMALTEFGYKVTGMDLSTVLLDEAKKLDGDRKVQWIRGDMRQIPLNHTFDAVMNLFTSFGYFESDEENERVLHEMDRVLKPGGKFIIDFLNSDYVTAHLVPSSERMTEGMKIQETRSIEDGFVRKRIVISEKGHPDRHYLEQVKLYRLQQFKEMLQGTNLNIDQLYGNYDKTSYHESTSPRLIIVGHKEG